MKKLIVFLILFWASTALAIDLLRPQTGDLSTYTLNLSEIGLSVSTTTGVFLTNWATTSSNYWLTQQSIANAQLANSSLTLNTTAPLGGGGSVSLGGTLTFTCTGCLTVAITSLGGLSGATQTFSAQGGLTINSATTVHTFTASSSPGFGFLRATSTSPSIFDGGLAITNGNIVASSTYAVFQNLAITASSTIGSLTGSTTTFASPALNFSTFATTTLLNNIHNALSFATSSRNIPVLSISTLNSQWGRIGVGTTSPYGIFSIEMDGLNPAFSISNAGSSSPAFTVLGINQDGKVGIATATPAKRLGVAGGAQFLEPAGTTTLRIDSNTAKVGGCIQLKATDGTDIRIYATTTPKNAFGGSEKLGGSSRGLVVEAGTCQITSN